MVNDREIAARDDSPVQIDRLPFTSIFRRVVPSCFSKTPICVIATKNR